MERKSLFWDKSGTMDSGSVMGMHALERKKGQKFSKDCSEWSIYRNFLQMYDEVYKAMETAGVAIRLPNATWVDKN